MVGIDNLKMLVVAAEAKTGPPLGPVLAPYYVNLVQFCKEFNAMTQNFETGVEVSVKVIVYQKKAYKIILGMPQLTLLVRSFTKVESQVNDILLTSFWYLLQYTIKYKVNKKYTLVGVVRMLFSFFLSFVKAWSVKSEDKFLYELVE